MAYRLVKDCMTAVATIDREERPKFSKVLMFWDHEDARATRQALYEGYKAKRDKEKRDKDPDRINLYMTMTSIKRALMSVHPRMMIQVEGMETDDVVAAFADLDEPMVIVIYPVLKQRFGDVLDLGLGLVTIPFMAADMDAIYRTLQYAIETEEPSNWEGFADTFAIQAIPLPQIEQSLV
jgi:hypothetical protein